MEPANVVPMDLDSDSENESERPLALEQEINPNIYTSLEELKQGIYLFKKNLFYAIVSNDSKHEAKSLGAMYSFHALFLQCVAYWIGMLDSTTVPNPKFTSEVHTKEFQALTRAIQTIAHSSTDARVLTYNLLFKFSTAHPYDLGKRQSSDEN
jgi:hypothetical protein